MNQKIEFKKDCMLKTYVSSITDISLTHDYKILDDTIEGYFDVTGSYKVTMSSVETESFMFTIPFTIALSSLIDKDTIDLKLSDFNYSVEKDVLHLKMFLDMDYQEIEIKEDTKDNEEIDNMINDLIDKDSTNNIKSPSEFHNEVMLDNVIDSKEEVKENVSEKNFNTIFNEVKESNFSKYKVYIMRSEDTLESILVKYNVTMDEIKEYNDIDNINIGSKIVIPYNKNEQD
ncbi:unknown [Clostridium sp. CAG:628]|nr:unknown [Clostridium sp. CAG:628]